MGGERGIGVLGGTFDPPHLGHLIVASEACVALNLERVLFIPAAVPPHKRSQNVTSAEQRLAMVQAAIRGDGRFEADDLELRREGPSYTVDTLRALRERFPAFELFFLIGADALREFHTWKEPDEVARLAHLVVFARGGEPAEPYGSLPTRLLVVPRIDISATEIRHRVRAGISVRYLVPDAVREIIEQEKLYRNHES